MPFGLSIVPFIFTKILKRPIAILRSFGIHQIVYLDDIQISATNPTLLSRDTNQLSHYFPSGFQNKPREADSNSNPSYGVPRHGYQLEHNDPESPFYYFNEPNFTVPLPATQGDVYSTSTSRPHRPDYLRENSDSASTGILPFVTARFNKIPSFVEGLHNMLTHVLSPYRISTNGHPMRMHGTQPHSQEGDRFPNTDRCLTDRLESSIWQQKSSRPMVPRGENNAHKHTGAQSSTLWSENFCEGTLAPEFKQITRQ